MRPCSESCSQATCPARWRCAGRRGRARLAGRADTSCASRAQAAHSLSPAPWLVRPQDTVVLNAGTALYVYGKAASVREGCDMARAAIKSGAPLKTLAAWAGVCSRFA